MARRGVEGAGSKRAEAYTHDDAKRPNNPEAGFISVSAEAEGDVNPAGLSMNGFASMDKFAAITTNLNVLGSRIGAPTRAGLSDDNLRECRKARLQTLPDIARKDLRGGVFKPGDMIEAVMVERGKNRLECSLDLGEVHHPTWVIEGTCYMDLDSKGMAMQAPTLVPFGNVRQPMCRLNGKLLKDLKSRHKDRTASQEAWMLTGASDE